jgi:hypothetical protein
MSYRKYMPRDRVERIDALKRRAALLGLSVQVANRGSRLVRLYRISFHRGDAPVAGFCELRTRKLGLMEALMTAPPEPDMRRAVTRQSDSPISQSHLPCTDISTEAKAADQERSTLDLQIFVLARHCAISAPMAQALAPWIWGLRS